MLFKHRKPDVNILWRIRDKLFVYFLLHWLIFRHGLETVWLFQIYFAVQSP